METEGYCESDYFNGTGAFIETSKELYIVNVESWNNKGCVTENDFDENELMSWVT